jgi:aspartate ammonia-lyase
MGAFVMFSGLLKRIAVKLSKICNDLRLLSSGPRTGIGELKLPAVQAGSSIMPGKVNPVIPEVVNQVAFLVIGHDMTVTMCAEGGQLQLNAFEPTIGYCIMNSLRMLTAAVETLRTRCVEGIEVDRERCESLVRGSIGLVTALVPSLGYENSSRVARRALAERKSVAEVVLEEKLLTESQLNTLLELEAMTHPSRPKIRVAPSGATLPNHTAPDAP